MRTFTCWYGMPDDRRVAVAEMSEATAPMAALRFAEKHRDGMDSTCVYVAVGDDVHAYRCHFEAGGVGFDVGLMGIFDRDGGHTSGPCPSGASHLLDEIDRLKAQLTDDKEV